MVVISDEIPFFEVINGPHFAGVIRIVDDIVADGDFGLETERNVKGFQRVSGLEVDGIFGPKSYEALMNALSRYVEITGNLVNVRKGPGVQYAVMGVVKDGDRLPYGGQMQNGWYLVEYDTQNAWVSGKYGRLVE